MTFKKKTNIIFILVFLALSISVGLFNYIVDPYGIRNIRANNFSIYHYSRDMIYTYINQTKNIKFDGVVVGGSSAGMVFQPEIFNRDTSKNFAMLSLEGISPQEILTLLTYFIDIHPEIKTVFMSVEPLQYMKCYSSKTLPEKPTTFLYDFIKLYYSFDTTFLSFKMLNDRKESFDENDNIAYLFNKKIKYTYDNCENDNFLYIKQVKKILDDKNIEIKFFILPVHSLFLSDLYLKKKIDVLNRLKYKLVELAPFYDMAYVNKYTKDPFLYFWKDVIHLSQFLSPYIYEVLFYGKDYPELSIIINSENIDKKIKLQNILIKNYIEENKNYVEKYVNYAYDFKMDGAYDDKRYLKDIPEPYKTRFYTEYEEYYKK